MLRRGAWERSEAFHPGFWAADAALPGSGLRADAGAAALRAPGSGSGLGGSPLQLPALLTPRLGGGGSCAGLEAPADQVVPTPIRSSYRLRAKVRGQRGAPARAGPGGPGKVKSGFQMSLRYRCFRRREPLRDPAYGGKKEKRRRKKKSKSGVAHERIRNEK